jgi:hypothetical protein
MEMRSRFRIVGLCFALLASRSGFAAHSLDEAIRMLDYGIDARTNLVVQVFALNR